MRIFSSVFCSDSGFQLTAAVVLTSDATSETTISGSFKTYVFRSDKATVHTSLFLKPVSTGF
jgi:hypothetical protein